MRVVTRALSMASTVSGRPGPVPGCGGNWAWPRATNMQANATSAPYIRLFTEFSGKRILFLFYCVFFDLTFFTFHPLRISGGCFSKRPLFSVPSPDQKRHDSERNLQQPPFSRGSRSPKQPHPAEHRQNRGHRIEPHLEGKTLRTPMNWTISRTARMPTIAVCRFNDTLKRKASPPRIKRETLGKCFVGWTRAKIGKKLLSRAAE